MLTRPSVVQAANTVEAYGAQATSPTELFKSNVNMGSLYENKHRFHVTCYTSESLVSSKGSDLTI